MAAEVVDPDGNVTVACKGVRFLVSSTAISLASPVFHALFNSGFSEGLSLTATGPGSNPVIQLPEDDPDAFRIFSSVAHHKLHSLPTQPSNAVLEHLAMFIDKYACVPIMRDRGRIWLQRALESPSQEDLWLLLNFAYALDSHTFVTKVSRMIINGQKGQFRRWKYAKDHMGLLTEEVLDQLDAIHESIIWKIQDTLMQEVTQQFRNSCAFTSDIVYPYIRRLGQGGILPCTAEFNDKSITEILEAAARFPRTVDNYCGHNCGTCKDLRDLAERDRLLPRLRKCVMEEEGLCLRCFNKGPCSNHSGTG
ncbi:hypothetical protein BJX76DRAFT_361168 [Aspergillus varians]